MNKLTQHTYTWLILHSYMECNYIKNTRTQVWHVTEFLSHVSVWFLKIPYSRLCPEHVQCCWDRASVVLIPVLPSNYSCPAMWVKWFCLDPVHGHLSACFPPTLYLRRKRILRIQHCSCLKNGNTSGQWLKCLLIRHTVYLLLIGKKYWEKEYHVVDNKNWRLKRIILQMIRPRK